MVDLQGKKVLFIIAPDKFRDEELFDTKAEIDSAGAETIVASRNTGEISGSMGGEVQATLALNNVNPSEFNAVVFVGGPGAAEYFNDTTAQKIAKDFANKTPEHKNFSSKT